MSPRPSAGPAGADPAVTTPHGFDIVPTLSTRPQWFPCGPLPVRHLTWFFPGLFLLCSRPWLLTTAAGGGLEPAPASRFRGAVPHRLDSYALRRSFRSPSRSWRTVIRVPNQHDAFVESSAVGRGFWSSYVPAVGSLHLLVTAWLKRGASRKVLMTFTTVENVDYASGTYQRLRSPHSPPAY